jgi:hypothetical protein
VSGLLLPIGPILPARCRRIARAVAETLFDTGTTPEEVFEIFFAEMDDWVRHAGPKTVFAVRLGLTVVQWSPIRTLGRPRRFTSLDRESRRLHLEKVERDPLLALPLAGLRTVLGILWFELEGAKRLPPLVRTARPDDVIVRRRAS